jgi:hypothetical protein
MKRYDWKSVNGEDVEYETSTGRYMHSSEVTEALSRRVAQAFDLISRANTVTILSLSEMEALVNRALTGEFED